MFCTINSFTVEYVICWGFDVYVGQISLIYFHSCFYWSSLVDCLSHLCYGHSLCRSSCLFWNICHTLIPYVLVVKLMDVVFVGFLVHTSLIISYDSYEFSWYLQKSLVLTSNLRDFSSNIWAIFVRSRTLRGIIERYQSILLLLGVLFDSPDYRPLGQFSALFLCSQRCWHSHQRNHNVFNVMLV